VGNITLFDQVSAALPNQGWALPGLICGQQLEQFLRPLRIVGGKKLALRLGSCDELVFQGRAAFENADQMLETLLPGSGHFRGAHRVRHMTHERHGLLARLIGDGKDGVAWNQRLQFDDVCAAPLQIIDGAASVLRCPNRNGTGEAWLWPVQHRA
jgi:hypothetical protein